MSIADFVRETTDSRRIELEIRRAIKQKDYPRAGGWIREAKKFNGQNPRIINYIPIKKYEQKLRNGMSSFERMIRYLGKTTVRREYIN
jgi:hypothetical protein